MTAIASRIHLVFLGGASVTLPPSFTWLRYSPLLSMTCLAMAAGVTIGLLMSSSSCRGLRVSPSPRSASRQLLV